MKERTYVAASIREVVFDNGGSLLNANFKIDDLEKHSKNGWVSLTISKRREPSEKGATHYAYLNEFEPKAQDNTTSHNTSDDNPFDDLPF